MKSPIIAFILVASVATAAFARKDVDETHPAAADGVVSVELISGDIRIEGTGRSEVRITGSLADHETLKVKAGERRTSIEVELPKGSGSYSGSADLIIRVPKGSRVEVSSISAPIKVSGVGGGLEVETVSGDIDVTDPSGALELSSVSGRIEASSKSAVRSAQAETVSSTISLDLDVEREGTIEASTVSGRITVRVPSSLGADVDMATFSGSLTNGLTDDRPEKVSFLPAKDLSFSVGGGGATISLSSFSGSVELKAR